jgi:hypothetical protein
MTKTDWRKSGRNNFRKNLQQNSDRDRRVSVCYCDGLDSIGLDWVFGVTDLTVPQIRSDPIRSYLIISYCTAQLCTAQHSTECDGAKQSDNKKDWDQQWDEGARKDRRGEVAKWCKGRRIDRQRRQL